MSSSDLNRVSQNLSLRLSPQRKYPPSATLCRPCYVCCCNPCICCHYRCCHCCCYPCCCSPCLNFDYSSPLEKDKNLKYSKNMIDDKNVDQNEPLKEEEKEKIVNEYRNYEKNKFNDFLRKLMEIESKLEDAKISLAINPDFNCEDAFRLFELMIKDSSIKLISKTDLIYYVFSPQIEN